MRNINRLGSYVFFFLLAALTVLVLVYAWNLEDWGPLFSIFTKE